MFSRLRKIIEFGFFWSVLGAFAFLISLFRIYVLPATAKYEYAFLVNGVILTAFLFVFAIAVKHFYDKQIKQRTTSHDRVLVLIEKKYNDSFAYCESVRSSIRDFVNTHQGADHFERTLSDQKNWSKSSEEIFIEGMKTFISYPEVYGSAIAVFPSEEAVNFGKQQTDEWLAVIKKQNQKLICIDSGYKLRNEKTKENVVLALCEHATATKKIIRAIHDELLPKIEQGNIQFVLTECVTMNTAVNIRRQEFGKLMTLVTARMSRVADTEVSGLEVFYNKIEKLLVDNENQLWRGIARDFSRSRVSSYSRKLTLNKCEWSREGVAKAMRNHNEFLEIPLNTHIIYLCENDDVGMGIADAYSEKYSNESEFNSRISIAGFDGTEDFFQLAERLNINAVTYAVDFSELKKNIETIVRSSANYTPTIGGSVKVFTHE